MVYKSYTKDDKMNTDNLSDMQLATCVDEFIKRTMQSIRNAGIVTNVQLSITAIQYTPTSDYKIKHRATVGDYSKQNVSETNNLMRAAHNAGSQWLADQLDAPVTVRQQIIHQPEVVEEQEDELATAEQPQEAEYVDIPEQPYAGEE
jgi:hypothetical protein